MHLPRGKFPHHLPKGTITKDRAQRQPNDLPERELSLCRNASSTPPVVFILRTPREWMQWLKLPLPTPRRERHYFTEEPGPPNRAARTKRCKPREEERRNDRFGVVGTCPRANGSPRGPRPFRYALRLQECWVCLRFRPPDSGTVRATPLPFSGLSPARSGTRHHTLGIRETKKRVKDEENRKERVFRDRRVNPVKG